MYGGLENPTWFNDAFEWAMLLTMAGVGCVIVWCAWKARR